MLRRRGGLEWRPQDGLPELDPASLLPAPLEAVGMAWSRDDDGPIVTAAYAHARAEDATANAQQLDGIWTKDRLVGGSPAELVTVVDVRVDGRVAIVTARPAGDDARHIELFRFLDWGEVNDVPFVSRASASPEEPTD